MWENCINTTQHRTRITRGSLLLPYQTRSEKLQYVFHITFVVGIHFVMRCSRGLHANAHCDAVFLRIYTQTHSHPLNIYCVAEEYEKCGAMFFQHYSLCKQANTHAEPQFDLKCETTCVYTRRNKRAERCKWIVIMSKSHNKTIT